jgi:hypothetical protein
VLSKHKTLSSIPDTVKEKQKKLPLKELRSNCTSQEGDVLEGNKVFHGIKGQKSGLQKT